MSIFDPRPIYRVASRAENLTAVLDTPFNPLSTFGGGFALGMEDSFGLGSVVRDLQTPRGVPAGGPGLAEGALEASPIIGPFVQGYEFLRQKGFIGAPTTGKPLDEAGYKTSPYYRKDIPWDAGMTDDRAASLAAQSDLRAARTYFGAKNPVVSFAGSLVGGGIDPVNFVPLFGPAARLAAVGRLGAIMGHALIGASEAAVNTAIFGAVTSGVRARYGDDVAWQGAVNNIAFSALFGAVIGGGVGAIVRLRKGGSSRLRAAAEADIRTRAQSIQNLVDSRAVLNDAVQTLATEGRVDLTPASGERLQRMATDFGDRAETARALDDETRGVTATKPGEVVISPSGARVAVKPEVVDLSQLRAASGDLQVRDRSAQNPASAKQVEDIAINLDPARLMPNIDGSQGAPLVGADGVVDSGNGRVAAISRVYDAYPDKAAAYRQAIEDQGFSTEGMDRPVLIQRRTTDLSPAARQQFNAELNSPTVARMSAVETAAMDRAALNDRALREFADAPVTASANKGFVRAFLDNLPKNEHAALLDREGNLSADGQRRIENALLAAAYGDVDPLVLRKFAEATDDNTKAIVGAMADTAGKWLRLRRAASTGEIGAEFDQTPELTQALRKLSGWREDAAREKRPVGTVIKEGMAQGDILAGEASGPVRLFIRSFYRDANFTQSASRETIAARLDDLVRVSMDAGKPDMFGEAYAATKLGVLKHAYGDLGTDLLEDERLGKSDGTVGGEGARPEVAQNSNSGGEGSGTGAGDRSLDAGGRLDPRLAGTKAVDATGEPVLLFHGTPKKFKGAFDPKRAGSRNADSDDGFAFTPDRSVAEGYRRKNIFGSGEVKEAYLNLQNPRIVDMADHKGDTLDSMLTKGIVLDGARSDGHDGVIFRNIADNADLGAHRSDVYIAFNPDQIVERSSIVEPAHDRPENGTAAGSELGRPATPGVERVTGQWRALGLNPVVIGGEVLPPNGTVRLYRGEGEAHQRGGNWWTIDREESHIYAGGNLPLYMDVPEATWADLRKRFDGGPNKVHITDAGVRGALPAPRPLSDTMIENGSGGPADRVAAVADLKARQPARSLDELYAVAPEHQAALGEFGREAAGDGVEWVDPGLKAKAGTEEKMARKGYKSTSQLTDVVRGGFKVAKPDQADALVAGLRQRFGEIVDEGWNVTAAGYFDRKVLVRFGDGTVGEVQFWHPDMLEAKERGGHQLYKQMAALKPDDPKFDELLQKQRELYSSALERAGDDWLPVLSGLVDRDMPGGRPASGKAASNVASESTRPESITSAALARDQSSSGAARNQAEDGSSITAGRDSQSKNVVFMGRDVGPPVVDMQEALPLAPPDGLDAASARVGQGEDMKALAAQYGVDPITGDFDEMVDIDQLREGGLLTAEDEAVLAAADSAVDDANAYAETLKAAAACVTG